MYAKGRGLLLECHQIFWTPMEIASRGKLYPVTNRALQIGRRLLHRRKIKTVFVAGVRRGNDVRNPISNRHFRHGQRFFNGFRSVIRAMRSRFAIFPARTSAPQKSAASWLKEFFLPGCRPRYLPGKPLESAAIPFARKRIPRARTRSPPAIQSVVSTPPDLFLAPGAG